MGNSSSWAETILPLRPQVIFGHIRGKQESCEKHISDCKTEVECEACNMKTLRSRENLFIKYPSVAHSSPSNRQQSLLYVWCIIRPSHYNIYMCTCCKRRMTVWQTAPSMCVSVWLCTVPHNLHLYQEPDCGMYQFGLKMGAGTVFCGKNATHRVNCLSDMSCVWFNA